MERAANQPPPAGDNPRPAEGEPPVPSLQDHDEDDASDDDSSMATASARDNQLPFTPAGSFRGDAGEQAEFRERFDEDLFNDREDHPAQGNTADVAMGEQRFGSDADAYTEYAWRRPGDHHRGEESAVGQARDPADVADDDGAS